jgi:hypothetical protein
MGSTELTVLDRRLPLKAYPKKDLDNVLKTHFMFWLSKLLSMKPDKEEQIKDSFPAIKKHCWSMGLREMKTMFEMYADGELKTQPKSNHFDRVLVGQIVNDYRKHKFTKPKSKDTDQEKAQKDMLYVIQLFDYFIQERKIPKESVWVYSYLESKGLIDYSVKEKQIAYKISFDQYKDKDKAISASKRVLVRRFFEKTEAKDQHIKDLI